MKQHLNALRVFEKLWEASKAVADCKMSAARGGEKWALEEHTFYRLLFCHWFFPQATDAAEFSR